MFTALCILSMLLFVVGAMIALSMKNGYLVPVLAARLGAPAFLLCEAHGRAA